MLLNKTAYSACLPTINRGEDDLDAAPLPRGRVRRAGGGRRAVSASDAGLVPELKRLVEAVTLGDPERPLLWASKSMDKLAATLTVMGHPISADTVAKELVKLGFSRQHNRKAEEGAGFTFQVRHRVVERKPRLASGIRGIFVGLS